MTDSALRTLLARLLVQAATNGDRAFVRALTPAAKGDPKALAAFRKAVESGQGLREKAFSESDHPRGNPENAGEFTKSPGGGKAGTGKTSNGGNPRESRTAAKKSPFGRADDPEPEDWVHTPTDRTQNMWTNRFTGVSRYTKQQPRGRSPEQRQKQVAERAERMKHPCQIHPNSDKDVQKWQALTGMSAQDIISAVGSPNGGLLNVGIGRDGRSISITVDHPDSLSWSRTLAANSDGSISCHNNLFFLRPSARGGGGAEMLANQVKGCAAAGVSQLVTCAGRGTMDGIKMNGYSTWPRLGYDAPVPSYITDKLPGPLKGTKTLGELYQSEEGRKVWEKYGTSTTMTFEINPESRSVKRLSEYLQSKGKAGLEVTDEQYQQTKLANERRLPHARELALAPVHQRFRNQMAKSGLDLNELQRVAEQSASEIVATRGLSAEKSLQMGYDFAIRTMANDRFTSRMDARVDLREHWVRNAESHGINAAEMVKLARSDLNRLDSAITMEPDETKAVEQAYANAFTKLQEQRGTRG